MRENKKRKADTRLNSAPSDAGLVLPNMALELMGVCTRQTGIRGHLDRPRGQTAATPHCAIKAKKGTAPITVLGRFRKVCVFSSGILWAWLQMLYVLILCIIYSRMLSSQPLSQELEAQSHVPRLQ